MICDETDLQYILKKKGTKGREEGKKTVFYLTTHSTHFIYGYLYYGVGHMVKDHTDREREIPLPPLHGLLFPISSKGFFYRRERDVAPW